MYIVDLTTGFPPLDRETKDCLLSEAFAVAWVSVAVRASPRKLDSCWELTVTALSDLIKIGAERASHFTVDVVLQANTEGKIQK